MFPENFSFLPNKKNGISTIFCCWRLNSKCYTKLQGFDLFLRQLFMEQKAFGSSLPCLCHANGTTEYPEVMQRSNMQRFPKICPSFYKHFADILPNFQQICPKGKFLQIFPTLGGCTTPCHLAHTHIAVIPCSDSNFCTPKPSCSLEQPRSHWKHAHFAVGHGHI